MAEEFAKLECQLHTTMWIARVPSKATLPIRHQEA
jgi:hypothetical protein